MCKLICQIKEENKGEDVTCERMRLGAPNQASHSPSSVCINFQSILIFGIWEILDQSSHISLWQRSPRIGHWKISNFFNGVVQKKYGRTFSLGHLEIVKSWRHGIIVTPLISSFLIPPIPTHSFHSFKKLNLRDFKCGNILSLYLSRFWKSLDGRGSISY